MAKLNTPPYPKPPRFLLVMLGSAVAFFISRAERGNAGCRRPQELKKQPPLGRKAGGLVARCDDRTKLVLRSRIGNAAVAPMLEGHRRPREGQGSLRQQ